MRWHMEGRRAPPGWNCSFDFAAAWRAQYNINIATVALNAGDVAVRHYLQTQKTTNKSLLFVCQHQTLFCGKRHNCYAVNVYVCFRSSVCSLGIAGHLVGCLTATEGNDAALTTLWQISHLHRLRQDGEKIKQELLLIRILSAAV